MSNISAAQRQYQAKISRNAIFGVVWLIILNYNTFWLLTFIWLLTFNCFGYGLLWPCSFFNALLNTQGEMNALLNYYKIIAIDREIFICLFIAYFILFFSAAAAAYPYHYPYLPPPSLPNNPIPITSQTHEGRYHWPSTMPFQQHSSR